MVSGTSPGARVIRLALTVCLIADWCGPLDRGQSFRVHAAGPMENSPTPEKLDRLFTALKTAQKQIPRVNFDPRAVVETIGRDPARLFEWVRDNTSWVPYQGALKGPVGVLADRVGNSLDRSLLLAELLRTAGFQTRLANAQLPPPQAASLPEKIRPPALTSPAAEPDSKSLIEGTLKRVAELQLDPSEFREAVQQAVGNAARNRRETLERTDAQYRMLVTALAQSVPARDDAAAHEQQTQALRDHWWVQYQEKGSWTDLDPLLPDAKPGSALATAARTVPLGASDGRIRVDNALRHEVAIRLVVEFYQDGKRSEQTVLNQVLFPAELIGQRISLAHIPASWPKDLDATNPEQDGKQLSDAVLAQHEWQPVLQVGSRQVLGTTFTDGGQLSGAEPAGRVGGGAGAGMGGLGGGLAGGESPASGKGELSAQWIEYEIRSPGKPRQVIRREVFDLLGPARRAAGNLRDWRASEQDRLARGTQILDRIEILPSVARLSLEQVSHTMFERLEKSLNTLTAALELPSQAERRRVILRELDGVVPISGPLCSMAWSHLEQGPLAGETYLDEPNIFNHRQGFRLGAKALVRGAELMDIVSNRVAVHRNTRENPWLVRLKRGVLDTAAEGLAISGSTSENAAAMFAGASAGGSKPVIIHPGGALPASPKMPPDVVARVERARKDGHILVVMSSAVSIDDAQRLAWYRVDPRTGQAVGVLDSGFHGAQEYILNVIRTALAYPPLVMGFWNAVFFVLNVEVFLLFVILLPLIAGLMVGIGINWTVDRAGRWIRK